MALVASVNLALNPTRAVLVGLASLAIPQNNIVWEIYNPEFILQNMQGFKTLEINFFFFKEYSLVNCSELRETNVPIHTN